jgi:hypothetical protein
MRDYQLEVYLESPQKYARIARQVDLAMRLTDKPCISRPCDEGAPCKRHAHVYAVVERYQRMKGEGQ